MKITLPKISVTLLMLVSATAMAKPMPNHIVVDDKAVVPIVKTQTIQRVEGQQPVRTTEATIFEVSNKGQDIVAREVALQDNESTFSDKGMSIPVLKQGGVIVPTSKIEVKQTLKQDNQVVSEKNTIDAEGVEFKKNGEVVKRQLLLDQQSHTDANEKMSHAVVSENGKVTKDIVIFNEKE